MGKIYGEYMFEQEWLVWSAETTPEQGQKIRASGPRQAAQEWAEQDDKSSDDYSVIVNVQNVTDGKTVRVAVEAEVDVYYNARFIDDTDEDG